MKLNLIKQVVAELAELIAGSRVSKIHQPAPAAFVFKLWTGRETFRLLLSADGRNSRLHLTEQTWPNPHIPPRFCQLLRARISRLLSISVINNDRIVKLDCTGKDGDCSLIIELIGNRPNMVLIDNDGLIIDVLVRVEGTAEYRALMPQEQYQYPKLKKLVSTGNDLELQNESATESWNQYVEKLYSDSGGVENKASFSHQVEQTVVKQIKKLRKRLAVIETDLSSQQESGRFKLLGELLIANIYTLSQGMESIVVLNYYDSPATEIEITLDPLLNPQQNAEKYFNRYKKGQRGVDHSERRLAETKLELEWLEQLRYQLNDSVNKSDIEEIAAELRQAGLLQDKNHLHSKRTLAPSKPHEAFSPSGYKVIWGRNNRQNDEISTKLLKNCDLWFHVANAPGAHVVMKVGNAVTTVNETDLSYAASIAAGYSKLRNDLKVEVMQADAKGVRKPRHAKAGLVSVLNYKTLLVKPLRLD